MAHNIYEQRMFCVGKAWHDIGVRVEHELQSAEAIKVAGLDYEVTKVPLYANINGHTTFTDVFGTLNNANNKVLGAVTKQYQIVQNSKAFEFFDEVVKSGEAIYHSAGALGDGEKIWILAKLPSNMLVFKDDIVEKFLLFTNSHDGTSAVKMYFTPIRVVCQNTLIASYKDARDGISIRHTGDIKAKVEEARKALGLALDFYKDFEVTAQKFLSIKMDDDRFLEYTNRVLKVNDVGEQSTRLVNTISTLTHLFHNGKGNNVDGVRNTLWAGYNAFTDFADHYKSTRVGNEVKSILFGSGATMKQRAFSEALALTK